MANKNSKLVLPQLPVILEDFEDGLDGWDSTVGSCGTCIRVRADDLGDLGGDAEPVGVPALDEVERVVVWEGEDLGHVVFHQVECDLLAFRQTARIRPGRHS